MSLHKGFAEQFTRDIPADVMDYLTKERGLSPAILRRYQLGWNKSHVTIPIFNRTGGLAFLKLAWLIRENPEIPKYTCFPAGNSAELYGWEHLGEIKPQMLVICEGEFDRLVLESRGIAAVSGTAGAGVFLPTWAKALSSIPNLCICFDRDEAGRKGAERIASMIPHAKIVELPEEVGTCGNITDYFVRLGKTIDDFKTLLHQAQPLPEEQRQKLREPSNFKPHNKANTIYSSDPRIQFLKENLALEEIAKNYIDKLNPSGQTLVGRCPFHADTRPSLVIYPNEQRFHCYGCDTHGDVIQFVMEAECLTFLQALDALEAELSQRQ